MFTINDDLSIYATRGDTVFFTVMAEDNGTPYKFQAGDVLRMKIFGKKDAENVVMEKCFPVTSETDKFAILLTEEDTKIGEVISKPTDYWYEIELNPFTNPQTIIGYDDDGAKIFKLYPEGKDSEETETEPENIPVVDDELDMVSNRPVENRAIARAIVKLDDSYKTLQKGVGDNLAVLSERLSEEAARMDTFVALKEGSTTGDAELADIRVGVDGITYGSAGTSIRSQVNRLTCEIESVLTGEPFNVAPSMRVHPGKFESDGTEGIATTTCITKAYHLSAGDKIQILDSSIVESVLLYDENGIRMSSYTAMTDNRCLLISDDCVARLYITCGADPNRAKLLAEKPQNYISVIHTPHIKSDKHNILSDVSLSMGKFHTGLGYEADDTLSIRVNEVVELKKGMVVAVHGVGMSMNAFTPNGRSYKSFRSPGGSFGAITNGRSPYEIKENMSVRLVFNATTTEQAEAFLANPERYVQIYDPSKIPGCFQPSALASAASINGEAEITAHCVSACTCNGNVYAAYYASEESNVETVSNTSIKIYLKEFRIGHPGGGKRILLCESGHIFDNFKQSNNSAPYDPQVVKVSDTELRIFFTAHDERGNSVLGYMTYNPTTGEVGTTFNKLQITNGQGHYVADKAGWEALLGDAGHGIANATFMCCTCKIINYSGKYYTILFSCSDGDKGVLLESEDLLNWNVVSFITTDSYTMCAEASVECDNGVFYALIRGENGIHFGTFNGDAWAFSHVSVACSRPLILRTANNDFVCLYNTCESRQAFMVADITEGEIIPRCNVFVGSQAHYFDYVKVGGNVWLFYSSDVKGIGNGRSSIQCATIDLNNGLFPY